MGIDVPPLSLPVNTTVCKTNEEKSKVNPVKTVDKKDETKISTQDKVSVSTDANSKESTKIIDLGFDDSKPGAPDKNKGIKDNRFPDRGRDIYIPLLSLGDDGVKFVNPLPASGVKKSSRGDGLALESPQLNAESNFVSIDAPTQMVAALFDKLSEKYPNVEKSVLYRLAKVGTFVAIDVPLMVASHEMGHAGAVTQAYPGTSAEVVVTNWMGGYTSYKFPKGITEDEKKDLFTSVAGMNQATFNGEEIDRRMHTQGADVSDAVQYLVNITNSVNYQMKDWIKNTDPGYNDGSTYHSIVESRNKGWNQENLSMLALGVNLLNADFWASLIGSANYIATGKQVKMPELEIGKVNLSMPHFSLMHTYEGPQINVSLYGNMNTPATLEVKYSSILTPDNGPAMGLETRLHNLEIPGTNGSLFVTPRAGVSVHNGDFGYKVGTGLEYRPGGNENFAVTAGFDYRHNYMPDAPLHGLGKDGIAGTAGVKLNF